MGPCLVAGSSWRCLASFLVLLWLGLAICDQHVGPVQHLKLPHCGDSGDTPPYAVEREIEDLEALIDATEGPAYLYGLSSGAAQVLEAAARSTEVAARGIDLELARLEGLQGQLGVFTRAQVLLTGF